MTRCGNWVIYYYTWNCLTTSLLTVLWNLSPNVVGHRVDHKRRILSWFRVFWVIVRQNLPLWVTSLGRFEKNTKWGFTFHYLPKSSSLTDLLKFWVTFSIRDRNSKLNYRSPYDMLVMCRARATRSSVVMWARTPATLLTTMHSRNAHFSIVVSKNHWD